MSRKTVQRVVVAAVLATALAIPVQAEARELRGPAPVWQWLTALWENSASILWPGNPSATTEKAGPGTDPNGTPLPNAGSSGAACGTECELRLGTDPNGAP